MQQNPPMLRRPALPPTEAGVKLREPGEAGISPSSRHVVSNLTCQGNLNRIYETLHTNHSAALWSRAALVPILVHTSHTDVFPFVEGGCPCNMSGMAYRHRYGNSDKHIGYTNEAPVYIKRCPSPQLHSLSPLPESPHKSNHEALYPPPRPGLRNQCAKRTHMVPCQSIQPQRRPKRCLRQNRSRHAPRRRALRPPRLRY